MYFMRNPRKSSATSATADGTVTPASADDIACDAARALSFAAFDGELITPELVAIEAHLQRCGPCRTHFASDAVFLRVVRASVTLDSAPRSLHDRIATLRQSHASARASA